MSIESGRTLTSGYFSSERDDVLSVVPATDSYLEVGCGMGTFGAALRTLHPGAAVWGIELVPEAAAEAAKHVDHVVVGAFPEVADDIDRTFGCIVCNDVLEHMADPWGALDRLVAMLSPGGTIVASIPNVRNPQTIFRLLVKGRWDYEPSGVLDRTHLRFFTKATMVEMFEEAGLSVERIVGSFPLGTARLARLRMTSWPVVRHLLFRQYILVGRPR